MFADGSYAGIASGAHELVAEWHEFVRDACGGEGLMFLSAEGLAALPSATTPPPGPLTAAAGTSGLPVAGSPTSRTPPPCASRDAPESSAASRIRVAEVWEPARRGAADASLGAHGRGDWRQLLARDEVAGVVAQRPRRQA